jgi:hypothetical protein
MHLAKAKTENIQIENESEFKKMLRIAKDKMTTPLTSKMKGMHNEWCCCALPIHFTSRSG